jgi:hypothetical protein
VYLGAKKVPTSGGTPIAVRYDYYEKLRESVLREICEHQPVSLLQLTQFIAPTYSFQQIKNELKRLVTEQLISRRRASKYEDSRLVASGFYYSLPNEEK